MKEITRDFLLRRFPVEKWLRFKAKCYEEGKTMKQVFIELIDGYLED